MFWAVQAFGEHIGGIEGSWYVFEFNVLTFNTVLYIMMFHIYVFGVSVKYWVSY